MKAMVIAGAVLALSIGVAAEAGDQPVAVKVPPADVTVKVDAPAGTSEQDIAAAISSENTKRDPAAQETARMAKHKADADQAHAERVSKVCDGIPEKSLRNDPSLRHMCQ